MSFGKLSIDGTKVRANASKRKAMTYNGIGCGFTAADEAEGLREKDSVQR